MIKSGEISNLVWGGSNWLKLVSVILLFAAILPAPYGFYTFLRWFSFSSFLFIGYQCYRNSDPGWMWIFGSLALAYNPIMPLHLGRSIWSIVNILTAVLLIFSLYDKGQTRMTKKQIAREWIVFLISFVAGFIVIPIVVSLLSGERGVWAELIEGVVDLNWEAWVIAFSPYILVQFTRSIIWSFRILKKDSSEENTSAK